jgi:PEP-CTERM motif
VNRIFKLTALALLSLGFAASAQAAFITSWTDSIDFGAGRRIDLLNPIAYQHDLTDHGFQVGSDVVTSIQLSIDLADNGDAGAERAFILVPTLLLGSTVSNFSYSGAEFGGWAVSGLWELNLFGTLSVLITSIQGDFNIMSSQLTAHGLTNNSNSVPEPGVLGLLGMGLLGIALSARRRKVTQR